MTRKTDHRPLAVAPRAGRRWLRGISAAAAGLIVLGTGLAAHADTLWVDAAAASAAPGSGCGTAAAYATINAAIAASPGGDTIQVCPGTYVENVIVNKPNLTLLGAKAGIPAGPDAVPAGRGTGESVIQPASGTGISCPPQAGSSCIIDGFTIQTTGNVKGISANPNAVPVLYRWNNNMIYGDRNNCGGSVSGMQSSEFPGGEALNNHIEGFGWGINIQAGAGTDPGTIQGNYFTGQDCNGAIILGNGNAPGFVISDNVVESEAGSMVLGSQDLQITHNTFQNNMYSQIYLHTGATGAVITDNDLLNTGNGFVQTTAFGAWVAGATNELHYNNLVNSATYGAYNNVTPGVQDVDATCNWWGSPAGPNTTGSGSDRVTAGVEYLPWLIAPAPGGACTGGTLPPTAVATAMPDNGDAPLAVSFDGSGSSDVDGTIVSYDWDFGDPASGPANTATGVTASHTYTTGGTYTATLTVTDNTSLTGTDQVTITAFSDTEMVVSVARLQYDNSTTRDRGVVKLKALLNDNDTAGDLRHSLLNDTVTVHVQDAVAAAGGPGGFDVTLNLTGCLAKGRTGARIVCKSDDGNTRAAFRPTRQGPYIYNARMVRKNIGDAETGVQQPTGPVQVTLEQDAISRRDIIGDLEVCRQQAHTRLTCIER